MIDVVETFVRPNKKGKNSTNTSWFIIRNGGQPKANKPELPHKYFTKSCIIARMNYLG